VPSERQSGGAATKDESSATLARMSFRRSSLLACLLASAAALSPAAARADGTYFPLASGTFSQDWSDASLITTNDVWSGVPSIIGYRGDLLAGASAVDPQTIVGEGTPVIDVNANQTLPNAFSTGGVTEFELTNSSIALSGSGTARAPNIVLHLDTTGRENVTFACLLRDLDGSTDNAVQAVAVQYRVGTTGNFINLPAGFVSDATTGPSLATATAMVSVTLPADAANVPQLQIRILTADATGNDEWVGIDDISVTSTAIPVALDFGDAPDSYGTTLASNGPRHPVGSLRLGTACAAEMDGTPSAFANLALDDDGLIGTPSLVPGAPSSISVSATGAGRLDAWFDWNGNGAFDGGEHALVDQPVAAGAQVLAIPVPFSVAFGSVIARFRISTAGTPLPTGLAADGEVEDHLIPIVGCGDGIVQAGEVCDDMGSTATCGCASDCSGFAAASTVCVPSSGGCDAPDLCDGSGACVVAVASVGTECRPSGGDCDVAESCDGVSAACPVDVLRPDIALCRATAGTCDVAEFCTGLSALCPVDVLRPNTFSCRASSGMCDPEESCTGTSDTCPADGFLPPSTVCRVSAGDCDLPESCTGTTGACPTDGFRSASAVCRTAAGDCDLPETCSGTGSDCPSDVLAPPSTVCRASAGDCDVAERCTGAAVACPSDVFAAPTTECRAAAGDCDVAESCTGTSSGCPSDVLAPPSTVCRTASGACDVAESCTGTAASCPSNASRPDGASCTDGAVCNGAEVCASGACGTATALDCDDSDVCTADGCAEPGGCMNMAIPNCCVTNADCTDDGDGCTVESCNTTTNRCARAPRDCDDADACTMDACSAGACTHDVVAACMDAGMSDAGMPDAGEPDAGMPDAGEPDAGDLDAGDLDAGDLDAGALDAGASDAGDGGAADAGIRDSGPRDAAPGADAGSDAGGMVVSTGCACGVGGGSASGALPIGLALLALIAVRRRARASR
jgi:MYXO-CTERM domain-containing protein